MSNTNSRSLNSKRSLFPDDGDVNLSSNGTTVASAGGCDDGENYFYHYDEGFSIQILADINKDKMVAPISPQPKSPDAHAFNASLFVGGTP
eukprot:2457992-Ditylum_brightwellii.AAC.1